MKKWHEYTYRFTNVNGCVFVSVGLIGGLIAEFAWWKVVVAVAFFGCGFIGAKFERVAK